eukprot:scaffold50858_cov18-Tisochrysis_lutea.AAC.1
MRLGMSAFAVLGAAAAAAPEAASVFAAVVAPTVDSCCQSWDGDGAAAAPDFKASSKGGPAGAGFC